MTIVYTISVSRVPGGRLDAGTVVVPPHRSVRAAVVR